MSIYYLYIKTHKNTGLKYLGKTTKDPFKYKGSGKDWKPHLDKYGNNHSTEILRECQSKEEVSQWGRYYSTLYNIVNAQDDFGNKIWANRIPETGGGTDNPSAETRAKLRIKSSGRIRSPETREKMSVSHIKSLTPEIRATRSKNARNISSETRAKRSKSAKNPSPEVRAIKSAAAKKREAKKREQKELVRQRSSSA